MPALGPHCATGETAGVGLGVGTYGGEEQALGFEKIRVDVSPWLTNENHSSKMPLPNIRGVASEALVWCSYVARVGGGN
jgi:hypothetical protein